MALAATTSSPSLFPKSDGVDPRRRRKPFPVIGTEGRSLSLHYATVPVRAKLGPPSLEYRKLGDSDLQISEVTLGTMTFGGQNTEKEAHELLSYAFECGVNILDTAEAVILATKVCGYSERSSYIRENAKVLRVDAANIKESVEKSLKRLGTDYIDLLQIHWPDRYVSLFGEFFYDYEKWRPSVPIVEQLRAFQELIKEGKVRYIGVSNETSYGVMEFVHASKTEGLPKIVSIQNNYSLLFRCKFEVDLAEVCHPNNCNIGLLAYSPLGGGSLSGKYLDMDSEAAKKGRLNIFPGYMERYRSSLAKEVTELYVQLAKKHGLTPTQLALGFVRDRPFMTSSIIGATSLEQLKEDLDVYALPRPLPPECPIARLSMYKRQSPAKSSADSVRIEGALRLCMALAATTPSPSFFPKSVGVGLRRRRKPFPVIGTKARSLSIHYATVPVRAKLGPPSLEYRKLGDSDLQISEVTLGTGSPLSSAAPNGRDAVVAWDEHSQRWWSDSGRTEFPRGCRRRPGRGRSPDLGRSEVTFGEQNTEKEAHELLSYAFECGVNILDTAEAVSPTLSPVALGSWHAALLLKVLLSHACLLY
ncbi:tas protein [Nymphaea thermarum]|nr:tas protein [Nymphaea thermarum]